MLSPYLEAVAAVLGLLLGSFLNVVIMRLPRGESIVTPRSHCRVCNTPIRWYDNLPLLSYLALRARCRACHARIAWRYPAVELAVAAWFTLVVHRLAPIFQVVGPVPVPFDTIAANVLQALGLALLGWLLIGLAVTDWQTQILPDASHPLAASPPPSSSSACRPFFSAPTRARSCSPAETPSRAPAASSTAATSCSPVPRPSSARASSPSAPPPSPSSRSAGSIAAVGVAIFPVLVIVAALRDLTSYTIPNWISLAALAAFVPAALLSGLPPAALGIALALGAAALLLGMAMFAFGWIGGGDAKLMAACGVWMGWTAFFPFLLWTAALGGALALTLLVMRKVRFWAPARTPAWALRLATPGENVPYGVAIALGALAVFPSTPVAHALLAGAHLTA